MNSHQPDVDGVRAGQHARHDVQPTGTTQEDPTTPAHRADVPREQTRRTRGILLASGVVVVVVLAASGAVAIMTGDDGNVEAAADAPATSVPSSATTTQPATETQLIGTDIRSVLSGPDEVTTDQRITGVDVAELELEVRTGTSEGLRSFSPRLDELTITADGQPVTTAPTELNAGDVVTVSLPEPAETVDIHFRALGQVDRTGSTVQGRAYVLVNGLIVRTPSGAAPVIVRLADPGVLNFACAAGDAQLACGHPSGKGWLVRFPEEYKDDAVLAQVDDVG